MGTRSGAETGTGNATDNGHATGNGSENGRIADILHEDQSNGLGRFQLLESAPNGQVNGHASLSKTELIFGSLRETAKALENLQDMEKLQALLTHLHTTDFRFKSPQQATDLVRSLQASPHRGVLEEPLTVEVSEGKAAFLNGKHSTKKWITAEFLETREGEDIYTVTLPVGSDISFRPGGDLERFPNGSITIAWIHNSNDAYAIETDRVPNIRLR